MEERIESVEPLLMKLASRSASANAPLEDLLQECRVALFVAYPRFDPRISSRVTFAYGQALGAIRHYLRDRSALIRRPVWRWVRA